MASVPAPAVARYYFCTVSIGGQQAASGMWPVAQSGIVEQEAAAAGGALGKQFYAHTKTQYRETFLEGCQGFDKFEEAERSLTRRKEQSPADVLTGWTGSFRPARPGRARTEESPGGAFISIEENGRQAQIDAWENSVLQMHRESAAIRARMLAATAAAKAEHARIMERVKAEMKKRGNKQ